jgi:hypothetical protein
MSGASTPRGNPSIATLQSIPSLQRQTITLTLENGRVRSSLTNAISECNSHRATNTTVVAENASLRQQICKLKELDEVGRRLSILSHHLEPLMESFDLLALRYSATMKPFYVIAAYMGETLYGLFDSFLSFPSWRQVQRYRDSPRKVLGLHEDIFSLSLEKFRSRAAMHARFIRHPSLPGHRCPVS